MSTSREVTTLLKPGQNKKGQNIFQLHHFLNTFYSWQLRKSIQKTGVAGKYFGPSYSVTALVSYLIFKIV